MIGSLFEAMLVGHNRCILFKPILFFQGATSQSIMLGLLGIKGLSLWIQVNSLLSLSDFDPGMSLDTFMFSRICMVNGELSLPNMSEYPEILIQWKF